MAKKRRINPQGPLLIGLCGARGAGKTTTAKAICERYVGFKRMSFADPVREAGWEILRNEALRDPIVKMYLGTTADPFAHGVKDTPIPGMEITPRDILIQVGEYERERDPAYWINKIRDRIIDCPDHVVIDDVRFRAEYSAIGAWGGIVLQIGEEEPDGDEFPTEIVSRDYRTPEEVAGVVVARAANGFGFMRRL